MISYELYRTIKKGSSNLPPKEQLQKLKQYLANPNQDLANEIVLSNLKLIAKEAISLAEVEEMNAPYVEDLISVGFI